MCGIAGCVGRPDRATLERMAAAMYHRGPDGGGVEIVGDVGLAHRRLAIVDPTPVGHQPMGDPESGWWLAYNGEVFNHLDLRRELPARAWRGGSDTETLLHALGTWGTEAAPRCNGLFAFAALDTRAGRLLLVRDRWGVKPLYWAHHDGTLWFASEIRALAAAGVPLRLERERLTRSLLRGWINGTETWLGNVRRVLPGTMLEIDVDTLGVTERAWYDPAGVVDGPSDPARLEDELRASVRRRLMADVPVGTMCSGGLDSSLVTAFARDEQPGIRAYNASVVDQPEVDEGPWAERVASALGVELRTVAMTADDWRAGLIGAALHNEHPLVHESSVPMAMIAGMAHQDGVKVLLSGEGADELFGGYDWAHAREARDWAARGPERVARDVYRRLRPVDEPDYERAVRRGALAAYGHHRGARRRYEAALLASLRTYLPHLLNRQDKNTMQRSIETRIPFLDPHVARFALNLPLEQRVRPRRKELLRALGARVLPREIGERPKVGFGFDMTRYLAPAQPGFLGDGALREALEVPRDDWEARLPQLRGQPLMLAVSAEILLRGLVGGESPAAIDRALWL